MSNKTRNTSGKFATKSETPRKIRSVNLTDDAWQWLADVAAQAGVSRNDYLEAMAEGNIPFMETAKPQTSPLIETVKSEINTEDADTVQQLNSDISPLMETDSKAKLDQARADYAKLLESSTLVADNLRRGVRELQARLEVERADREEIEAQLADLKQKSATAEKEFPDAADLLNQLRVKRKKSKTDSADIAAILEILEG